MVCNAQSEIVENIRTSQASAFLFLSHREPLQDQTYSSLKGSTAQLSVRSGAEGWRRRGGGERGGGGVYGGGRAGELK